MWDSVQGCDFPEKDFYDFYDFYDVYAFHDFHGFMLFAQAISS